MGVVNNVNYWDLLIKENHSRKGVAEQILYREIIAV